MAIDGGREVDAAFGGVAVALPALVPARSGMNEGFIERHEGTHYDQWLDVPFTFHVDYGVQFAADWIFYGSLEDADYASPVEQRGYARSNPGNSRPALTPVANPVRYIFDEIFGQFGF